MNLFRKAWLASKVKAILKEGNVDALKAVLGWIVKLKVVPSGWLTVGAGATAIAMGLLCYFGVEIPGVTCPADPALAITAGAGLIGLGRRSAS